MNLETHLSLGVTENIVSLEPKWPLFWLEKFLLKNAASGRFKPRAQKNTGQPASPKCWRKWQWNTSVFVGWMRMWMWQNDYNVYKLYKYYRTASWCTHMIYSSLYIMIYQYHVCLLSLWYSRNNCLWHCHFSIIFSCICICSALIFVLQPKAVGGFISPNHPETRQTFVLPSPACSNWRKIAFWLRVCRRTRVIERSFTHLAFWDPETKVWTLIFLLTKYVFAKSLDWASSIDLHKMLVKK